MVNWSQASYERTTERQSPLPPGGTLDVDTSSGTVTITGAETSECHVVAVITARAPSEEEAEALGEQVEIRLEQSSDTLKVRADEPKLGKNQSITVSYTITVPRRTNVQCHSSYGSLRLADLEGTIDGKSGSGSIEVENLRGATNLDTSYGSIACRNVAGQEVRLYSGSGSITASDIKGDARIDSSYGTVKCERFSNGDLFLRSGSGNVTVAQATFGKCEAISSYGPVRGNQLEGDVIRLLSGSGSVTLTEATAGSGPLEFLWQRQGVSGDDERSEGAFGQRERHDRLHRGQSGQPRRRDHQFVRQYRFHRAAHLRGRGAPRNQLR
jgi:DUF4097 and DUF4098 domain-containing protein YvlB